uniref:Uncharacterized protein n=1 Tax=Oryza glumipatula TaxID=40148 RepID=A0A0D9Y855_9ORYZ
MEKMVKWLWPCGKDHITTSVAGAPCPLNGRELRGREGKVGAGESSNGKSTTIVQYVASGVNEYV